MLKVKEGIPLERLLEFGFEERYSEKTGELVKYTGAEISTYTNERCQIIIKTNRRILDIQYYCERAVADKIYDMTKAGIIEKE